MNQSPIQSFAPLPCGQPAKWNPLITVILGILLASLAMIYLVRWRPPEPEVTAWSGKTMGTTYQVQIAGARISDRERAALQAEVDERLAEINRQMSPYQPDSEISRFNRHTSPAPFKVSAEFSTVMAFALAMHERSGGAFDPSLGPLIDLWGFGPASPTGAPPSDEQIQAARQISGAHRLTLTPGGELRKAIPELQLDLGAIAKGYGVDEVARAIRARGWTNVFVEIGGEVVTAGHNAEGEKWRVGIELPLPGGMPGEGCFAILHMSGLAIATSGDYRNFQVGDDGEILSHILDPETGRPVRNPPASVTVIASDCMTADALATALFVMGAEKGVEWLGRFYPGIEALFILRGPDGALTRRMTDGFDARTDFQPLVSPPAEQDEQSPGGRR